jgi:hypothetical protein
MEDQTGGEQFEVGIAEKFETFVGDVCDCGTAVIAVGLVTKWRLD